MVWCYEHPEHLLTHCSCLSGTMYRRLLYAQVLAMFAVLHALTLIHAENVDYQRFDGFFNNRGNPDWGTSGKQLTRKIPAAYSDGVYAYSGRDRPNPRTISQECMSGPSGLPSFRNRTVFLALFGQFVSLESIMSTRSTCPRELTPVDIPTGDQNYDRNSSGARKIPFLRSVYDKTSGKGSSNRREQISDTTSWIDGSVIYGATESRANLLRTFKGGQLRTRDGGKYPPLNTRDAPVVNTAPSREHRLMSPERQWLFGDPRLFQHPALLVFGVVFMRWHNHLADRLHNKHPDWGDEQLFYEARKWNIASLQKIIAYDFYPSFTNDHLPTYTGYKNHVYPGVTHMFQVAAFRMGHSMVPPGFYRRDGQCRYMNTTIKTKTPDQPAVNLCNSWFHADEAVEFGIEPFLMGMASQICEREDHIVVDEVRGKLFGPLQHSRRDLVMLNIMRGRDHGMADYNTARRLYGLPEITRWEDINPWLFKHNKEAIDNLRRVHEGLLDKLDIFVGGMFENGPEGPGQLFKTAIKDHFTRLRDADRYWFENNENGLFTADDIDTILNTTLYDIVLKITTIKEGQIQKDVFQWRDGDPCPQPKQLESEDMEACGENETFDFFQGSEISFIVILCSMALLPLIWVTIIQVLTLCKRGRLSKRIHSKKTTSENRNQANAGNNNLGDSNMFLATEVLDGKTSSRVSLIFNELTSNDMNMCVCDTNGNLLRTVDWNRYTAMRLTCSEDEQTAVVHLNNDCDLILQLDQTDHFKYLFSRLKHISQKVGATFRVTRMSLKKLLQTAETRQTRKEKVERFLKCAFTQIYNQDNKMGTTIKFALKRQEKNSLLNLEMSRVEFAEALSLKPDSLFLQQLFHVADKDNSGTISFREFLIFMTLCTGSEHDKIRMLFEMYDMDNSGSIDREEFQRLLRSAIEMIGSSIDNEEFNLVVEAMYRNAGYGTQDDLTFEQFKKLMDTTAAGSTETLSKRLRSYTPVNRALSPMSKKQSTFKSGFTCIGGDIDGTANGRQQLVFRTTSSPESAANASVNCWTQGWRAFRKLMENNDQKIFYLVMFYVVTTGFFAERAYHYSVGAEHAGFRRMVGHGVTITRGAASAMSFTYSLLLLTMCRNIMNSLRGTIFSAVFPLDAMYEFHQIVGWTSIALTVLHVTGHFVNFYQLSTQPSDFLECVFGNTIYFRSDFLPTFDFWIFQTVTGVTGVLLVVLVSAMVVFATKWARLKIYNVFWIIHQGYVPLYVLLILHGSAALVQEPWFHYFIVVPAFLFLMDKMVTMRRSVLPITVIRAEHLPSDVTRLVACKPKGFEFKAGQWMRISVQGFNESESHPFTVTSAPHENVLTFHIRCVGPWTWKVRELFSPKQHSLPKIFLDGPFGAQCERWTLYDVTVMVGAGIGVTPFASILKHVTYMKEIKTKLDCKQIYFIWVTRNQRQFEWMTDIIRYIESRDLHDYISVHVFITEGFGECDLRTAMLYMCEKHFMKISDRSLFTGLKAPSYFGRPDFCSILRQLEKEHEEVSKFGVFSCGPPSLSRAVRQACINSNKKSKNSTFHHFVEKF